MYNNINISRDRENYWKLFGWTLEIENIEAKNIFTEKRQRASLIGGKYTEIFKNCKNSIVIQKQTTLCGVPTL